MPTRAIVTALSAFVFLAAPALAAADQEPPSIAVSGEGRVFVKPDLAQIHVGVHTQASTAAKALESNNAAMAELMKTINAQGIAERDVQTSNFSINPNYANDGSGRAPRISGYNVSNDVKVTVRKVAQIGPFLDAVVQSGANQVGQISFTVDQESKLLDDARKQAFEDARRKAKIYADVAAVQLGKVLTVVEVGPTSIRPPMPMRMAAFSAEGAGVSISGGEQELKVSATVVFSISQ